MERHVEIEGRRRLYPIALLLKSGLVVLVLCATALWSFQTFLFRPGPKSWKGGEIGRRWDNALRRFLFARAVQRQRDAFHSILGFHLPACPERTANQVGAPVLTQQWLAETLVRAKRREVALQQYMRETGLLFSDDITSISDVDVACNQSLRVLRPNVDDWYRPWSPLVTFLDGTNVHASFQPLFFHQNEMEMMLETHFQLLYNHIYRYLSRKEQVQLWGICAVYWYGGIFLVPEIKSLAELPNLTRMSDQPCQIRVRITAANSIQYLAASARNHQLKCVIHKLNISLTTETEDETTRNLSILWSQIMHWLEHIRWDINCNEDVVGSSISYVASYKAEQQTVPLIDHRPRFQVSVSQASGISLAAKQTKRKRSEILQQTGCSAGWFCDRCLRIPSLGSLEACHHVCRTCYIEEQCQVQPNRTKATVTFHLAVKEVPNSPHKRIPRIIHQTWFEGLTTARYPHLQRMQHSWKASGWDYRFYTDEDARRYIQNNYPQLFVDAYDAIIPGAFKADLFRLLVLLKDGGIYSDVDVQLDANLDNFITTDLSFFVPRDVPLDSATNAEQVWFESTSSGDENYCLWNGLIGAAPGHPLVAKTVEDMMNRILNRHDYYDMEAELCQRGLTAEIWKLRVLPILLLTGPCALGISVNAALGRSNYVQGLELGWISNVSPPDHYYWGDAMTLLADRYDLGELRFTDIDRNLLLASSNPDRFAKDPLHSGEQQRKSPEHYSMFESDIVGEYGVYKDDQTTDEMIRIQVSHNFV